MTTWTAARAAKLTAYLASHHLPKGMGTKEAACSLAAINLAISGRLTDSIPDCMSEVVGKWIITTQDRMSDDARNSDAWKALLPLAAGTGRDHELERLAIAMDAMWEALAWVQPRADAQGYGTEWATMLRERTPAAANAASSASYAASAAAAAANAASAAAAAANAAYADANAANAAYADALAANAAYTAAYAASATYATANAAYAYDEWAIRTLGRLVA